MTVLKKLLFHVSILFIVSGMPAFSHAGYDAADLDRRVERIIQKIADYRYTEARSEVEQLIQKYPNFRLAHLIRGDLILMRAKPLEVLSGNGSMSPREQEGLLSEALYRLQASRETIPAGRIPSNLIQIPENQTHLIAIDAEKSRLYVLRHTNNHIEIAADYYMSVGKSGVEKRRQGDNKTPIGLYRVTSFIPAHKLPDYYGAGAFPLNYPNAWDKRNQRDGYGIWIHGTPSSTWTRPPLASEGCVVVANADFIDLQPYIDVANTPVLIAKKIKWVTQKQLYNERNQFLSLLSQWKKDLESLDIQRYLSHYSQQFSADGLNYEQWAQRKKNINARKDWINLDLSNISVIRYPQQPDLVIITFDQHYKSSNLTNQMRKTQYWLNENNQWKIIYEGEGS